MDRKPTSRLMCWLCVFVSAAGLAAADDKPSDTDGRLKPARVHLQKGRYEEALEAYQELAAEKIEPARVAVGISRAHEAQGNWQEATGVLEAALQTEAKNALLHARLAEVCFLQGRYADAEKSASTALQLDADQPLAQLVLADVFTETGRIDKADEAYRWFVRYYNRVQPEDAETLLLVARGSVQYARWHSVSQVFDFVINTLCPDALANDENCWQAHHLSGALLLEKYNRAQAIPDLRKAVAVNPQAADAYVALGSAALQQRDLDEARDFADRALEIDPNHVPALQLKSDVILSDGTTQEARQYLLRALAVNPHEQRTLARLAAGYLLEDGLPDDARLDGLLANLDAIGNFDAKDPTRFEKLVVELAGRNPKPGPFLAVLGETLDSHLKFDIAERLYKQAIAVMPQLSEPKTNLGMLYMRVGKTEEAQKLLDEAFEADPYHVRVSNMRKVLGVLAGYETIATDHFVIRVDSQADRILGRYMAEYLEEQYGPLVKHFGYEPPHRTQFEIYNNAKGLSAHQWFSARMIGLPWIQTIGASTGMIVALASPTSSDQQFNWARVLKHEFVHILTLQQTRFNIPHWFTEALAVTAEESPRPAVWNRLLLERVPAGKLWSLDELNRGFQRPESADDWQFAYCQSRLYAQYMIETFGEEKIGRMLDAYRNNISTKEAIPQVFGVDVETFETGYREFLNRVVSQLSGGAAPAPKSAAEAEKAYLADKENPSAMAGYAYVLLAGQQRRKARELATAALEKNEAEPRAAVVMASLELLSQDLDSAAKYLVPAINRERPNSEVVELLAKIRLSQEKYDEAAELYALGRKHFPHDVDWLKGQAAVALKREQGDGLKEVLEALAGMDPDNAVVRQKLAELALEAKEYERAVRYGREALYVDVLDIDTHRILAEAYSALKNHEKAIGEYEVAIELGPDDLDLQIALGRAYIAGGRKGDARTQLQKLLRANPENAEAKRLLIEIGNRE